MAARTAKQTKRIKTTMEFDNFEDLDPVMILSFSGQIKGACDSDGVPEGVAMSLLLFFMAKSLASLTTRMTPRKNPKNVCINVVEYRGRKAFRRTLKPLTTYSPPTRPMT